MKPKYDFAVLGAGAIGSILGAHLAKAGHSVVMLARDRRAEQVRKEGLRIKGLVEFSVPVDVIAEPGELGAADVLIVATKTPGTEEALSALRNADIDVTLSIQNGPLKNELLAQAFGEARVLGALADTSGQLSPDGQVLFTRNVNLLVGELSGALSERAQKVAKDLDAAGVRAAAVDNIRTLEWSKFVGWVGLVVLAVTTRSATWRYLTDPGSALVLVRLVQEMGRLAAALKIALNDHAVLPSATICSRSEAEAVAAVIAVGREFESKAPSHWMSALQDLKAQRPLEIHETLGYALNKAAGIGVQMPLVDAFYHLIAALDRFSRDI
jgi:2-dehydropantoate 2-reductase